MLPVAVAKAAEAALTQLAPHLVPVALEALEVLTRRLPPEAVPLVRQLIVQIATSPAPLETAKRAVIATASSEAADEVLARILKGR
jgi:hypothetical protein